MAFTPKTWADGEAGGTPITAEELNRIEAGIEDAQNDDINVAWGDVTGKPAIIAAGATQAAARDVLNLGEMATADAVAWGDVAGKPTTFAPSEHAHEITDVTGLQDALDAKAGKVNQGQYSMLETGTDTAGRPWSAKDLADYVNAQIAAAAVGASE